MRRGKPLKRRAPLKRVRMRRRPVKRHWVDARAKVDASGRCRGCGRDIETLRRMGRTLDAAHIIGREHDLRFENGERYVHPDSVFELCGPQVNTGTCHNLYDGHQLNMWAALTGAERKWVIGRIGEGQARRRVEGRPK